MNEDVGCRTVIGHVGQSGNVTGSHLLNEQFANGNVVRASFGGNDVFYFGTRNYQRVAGCD